MIMIILLHVLIALGSIAHATYTFFRPSQAKLYVSYGLIVATIGSGTVLVIGASGHMLESCTMGLLYIAGASVLTAKAHGRLAAQQVSIRQDIQ
jgi:hypothetical protein